MRDLKTIFRNILQTSHVSWMMILGQNKFRREDFSVVTINLPVKGLPQDFDGYRIVHITDIHIGQWITPERLLGVVELVNEQEPDAVALTGDFVSYLLDPYTDFLQQYLSLLRPKDFTFAVLGNHDHWADAERISDALHAAGVIELKNQVYSISRGLSKLYFAGVDDIMVGKDRLDMVLSKLPANQPAVLLVHEPDFADKSAATNHFFLQLSGHSHGGQIVIPGFGPLIRGPYFYKYPRGKYEVGDMILYTNSGIGTNTIWTRWNCPPEVAVITLTTEPAD
jgi:uncharacterized protein